MLLRKVRISASLKMITGLNNLVLSPVSDKNHIFLQSPQVQTASRIQFLHSSKPISNNSNQFVPKSVAQSSIALSTDGIRRPVKADAQAALFDYLHTTRGLSFLDSEHISKNSPRFLEGLLAKVDSEKDVLRALTKFFRYHPINEFEPFFESMGLSEREYAPFLPQELIFLSDDELLLDNYHTLSSYGLPRCEIGRLFKEVNEIFRYEYGVLNMKLRAYEQLGLRRSNVIKLVSCSPQLLAGEVDNAFVRVLGRMKELGFDSNWIVGHLSSKNTYNWNRMLETLCFLQELGFSDVQMEALFREDAALLFAGCGKQVDIVVALLVKLGLKVEEVLDLVVKNPQILSPKCAKNFSKALAILLEIGTKPEITVQILLSHMEVLASHSLKGLKTVLKDFNSDKHSLCEALEKNPSTFFNLAFKTKKSGAEFVAARSPNNIVEKTDFLLRLGYVENSEEMVKALKQFRGRGDQLQERFDCLVGAGLDFNTVSGMVKQAPTVLNQTRDILEKKMDCLKNYLGYPVESIAGFPSYLCYDMKRISLRFSMYAWLREKGYVKPMLSVSTLLACSDARFIKYYVNIHPNGPEMWENLKRSLASD
ncbi:transcription termination factor MTEF18, mitochondrial-like [Salvia hispanica]|uniref:transcription termination factor MTEF18, mitochondrial-like n=1 Tax=Salvia hispanica TaxID=49212 RepID=UPI002009BB41|nr:transcription termination factor MTEF18, mitochondrial-like [Salvia hispanica]